MAVLVSSGCKNGSAPDFFAGLMVSGLRSSEIEGAVFPLFARDDGEPADLGAPYPAPGRCALDDESPAPTSESPGGEPPSTGDVTITLDGRVVEIGPTGSGEIDPYPEGAWLGLAITGGRMPAFDVPDLLALPNLPIGSVSVGDDGSYTVGWTAGDADLMVLSISWDSGTLQCTVTDADGAFTVPADALLGSADEANASLTRIVTTDVLAADGRVRIRPIVIVLGEAG